MRVSSVWALRESGVEGSSGFTHRPGDHHHLRRNVVGDEDVALPVGRRCVRDAVRVEPVALASLAMALEDGEPRRVIRRLEPAVAAHRLAPWRAVVDVVLRRVCRHVGHVVVALRVVVLHEMVPLAPPRHLGRAAGRQIWLQLDHDVVPHLTAGQQLRVAAGGERLVLELALPHEHEHVAVGKKLNVVVQRYKTRQRAPTTAARCSS